MTRQKNDPEALARIERANAFIKWLWDRLEGDEAEKTVAITGVLDRIREVRADALDDAAGIAEQVLEMRPGSEPLKLMVINLRDYAALHRKLIDDIAVIDGSDKP